MSYLGAAAAISSRFATQWAASAYSAVPVQIDNEEYEPPKPNPKNAAASAWVRQTIIPNQTDNQTFSGSTQNHTFGTAQFDVFVPAGAGLGYALAVAEVIRNFFDRIEAGGVVYCVDGVGPSLEIAGKDDESGFFQVAVVVPWQYWDA